MKIQELFEAHPSDPEVVAQVKTIKQVLRGIEKVLDHEARAKDSR